MLALFFLNYLFVLTPFNFLNGIVHFVCISDFLPLMHVCSQIEDIYEKLCTELKAINRYFTMV